MVRIDQKIPLITPEVEDRFRCPVRMAELFKFRCFQCQKLIGAPPSKFGKVVKCPRCGKGPFDCCV